MVPLAWKVCEKGAAMNGGCVLSLHTLFSGTSPLTGGEVLSLRQVKVHEGV